MNARFWLFNVNFRRFNLVSATHHFPLATKVHGGIGVGVNVGVGVDFGIGVYLRQLFGFKFNFNWVIFFFWLRLQGFCEV